MLVLKRAPHETIIIRQDGKPDIVVANSGTGYAKIGVHAPPGVKILRGEMLDDPPRQPARAS